MATVLIVEDNAIVRELIEVVLKHEGFDVITVGDGNEAIQALDEHNPVLVLLDLALPTVDGITVLRRMRQTPAHVRTPVIIISALTDRTRITQAVSLGVSGYVLKANFSHTELVKRIRTTLGMPAEAASAPQQDSASQSPTNSASRSAPVAHPKPSLSPSSATPKPTQMAPLEPIARRAEVMSRLQPVESLEGFSPAVSQILHLTRSEHASIDSVANAINQDPILAVKILKIANSPAYTRGDRVQSVQKAVVRMGMSSVRQAVQSIGIVERFSAPSFNVHLSTPLFWEHSIAVGLIASNLAYSMTGKLSDIAFTCGLLHDVGRVILANALGETYVQVIEAARSRYVPLEVAEHQMLQATHADIMTKLVSSWGLPHELIDLIVLHHDSTESVRGKLPNRTEEVLRLILADRLAHAMLLGSSGNDVIYGTSELCKALGITGETIESTRSTVQQDTDEAKYALLSHSNIHIWPRHVEHLRKMLKVPFRPLYVSRTYDLDACRIFCETFAGSWPDEQPNIMVARISAKSESERFDEFIAAAEQEAGVNGLPVLIIANEGIQQPVLTQRAGRAIKMIHVPFDVRQFIAVVNTILGQASSASKAA